MVAVEVAVEGRAAILANQAVVAVLPPAAARNWLGCWLETGLSTAILPVTSPNLSGLLKSKSPKPQ